jgi:hypothetical protein
MVASENNRTNSISFVSVASFASGGKGWHARTSSARPVIFFIPLAAEPPAGPQARSRVTMPCTLFGVPNLVPVQGLPGPNANNRLQQVPCLTLT